MEMTTDLQDFAVRLDFHNLKDYFQGIKLDDLKDLTEEDLLNVTRPSDQLHMKLFIKKHLDPYFSDVFVRTESQPGAEPIQLEGILDLRNELIIIKYSGFPTNNTPVDKISEAWKPEVREKASWILASGNNLFAEDVIALRKILEAVFPNCKVLDLSNNRIHGQDLKIKAQLHDAILGMLTSQLHYLDISMNSFASVDEVKFFGRLSGEHYAKLIFIPNQAWLDAKHWRSLVPEGSWGTVEKAHEDYFKQKPQFRG